MEKSPEEYREIGKKFLDELKKKGPDLDMVGKTVVSFNNSDIDYEEPISESRKYRNTKVQLIKEFGPIKSDNQKHTKEVVDTPKSLKNFIEKWVFKYKFEKIIRQIKKDEIVIEQGVFRISLNEYKRCIERKTKNINWVYSKRNMIKKYYSNEFIMKLVRKLGFVDSIEWYS